MSRCMSFLLAAVVTSTAPVLTARADLADGLVGYWDFEEGAGVVAADASGNGNDGVLAPDEAYWNAEDPAVGQYALTVNGTHATEGVGFVEVPHSDSLNVGAGDFSIALWGKRDAGADRDDLITKKDDNADLSFFIVNDVLRLYARGAETLSVDSTDTIPTDQWVHMAVVRQDGIVTFYLNASESGGGENAVDFSSTGVMRIGSNRRPADNFTMNPFEGSLDDVRIYNRALSADDVRSLVPPKLKAREPIPSDGDVTVITPLLQWTPGETAVLHDVYLGIDPNLGPDDLVQSRMPMVLYFHEPGLVPGTRYYWRVDEIEQDMTTIHAGDVWTFVARPFNAYLPEPADAGYEVSPDPNLVLTWQAGRDAVTHQLYFGTSLADVNAGAAATDLGALTETRYMLADPLQTLATYYWRVDEMDLTGTVERGDVWSFTTFRAVDDFESYTNEIGQRVFEVWVDGIGFSQPEPGDPGNGSGAAVGHDVWDAAGPHYNGQIVETDTVHGGGQAMPLYYDNTAEPYYSEAERTWAAPQDWTADGVDALVLYVRGQLANAPEPLYVALEDAGMGANAVVHPDATAVGTRFWTRWEIPLSQFSDAGVNLSAVRKMIVGVGDRAAPTAGAAGLVTIDDIRLVRSATTE